MDLINSSIQSYAEQHTASESSVLSELNRQTHNEIDLPQMLSGHLQGRFLAMISQMIQPKAILEIGTYTGYSAICLAEGLSKDGQLHSIDVKDDLLDLANTYFTKANVKDKITTYCGAALDVIPTIEGSFDLVFIDADKRNYSNYFDLVIDRVRAGGFIVADNVLWSGRVLDDEQDKRTAALDSYNKKIHEDERVEHILLPIRDGLMVARKIGQST